MSTSLVRAGYSVIAAGTDPVTARSVIAAAVAAGFAPSVVEYSEQSGGYVVPTAVVPFYKGPDYTDDYLQTVFESDQVTALKQLTSHYVPTPTGVPTVAAGAAAGAAAADTAGVADTAGSLTATALAVTPVAGILTTVTLSVAEAAVPKAVILTAQNAAAVAAGLFVSAKSAGAFSVSCANVPAASAVLLFDYLLVA